MAQPICSSSNLVNYETNNELLPLQIIKRAFEEHGVKLIYCQLPKMGVKIGSQTNRDLLTSCTNTVYVLAELFLGEEKGIKLQKRLSYMSSQVAPVGNQHYIIENLFDGVTLSQVNKSALDFEKCSLPAKNFYAFQQTAAIRTSLINTIGQKVLTAECQGFPFDFNQPVIESLKKEMNDNLIEVTENHSLIYGIALRCPPLDKNNCYQDSPTIECLHSFLIEQFLFEGKVSYRRHQSWADQATFVEDSNKNKVWTQEDLEHFLSKLQKCIGKHEGTPTSLQECFGYGERHYPPYTFDNNTFRGISLRYYSSPFNPQDVKKNLDKLLATGY